MSSTLIDIIDAAIGQRAEEQAEHERHAFENELSALLTKHGVSAPRLAWPIISATSSEFAKARTAMISDDARNEAARRILGDEAGGGSKVEPN